MTAPRDTYPTATTTASCARWRTVANSAAYLRHPPAAGSGTARRGMRPRDADGRPRSPRGARAGRRDRPRRRRPRRGTTSRRGGRRDHGRAPRRRRPRPGRGGRVLGRGPRPPGAPARLRSGRGAGELWRSCATTVVAARDADYAGFAWYPEDPGLDRWLERYVAVARGNEAEPGRRAPAARLGAGRWLRRDHALGLGVVPRHGRGPCLVERPVGRQDPVVKVRRAGARAWADRCRRARRTALPRGGVGVPATAAGSILDGEVVCRG